MSVVCVRQGDGKHGEEVSIHKTTIEAWNGNEPGKKLQHGEGKGWSGSHLAQSLQDVREVVGHGGPQLQGTEVEGGDTGVGTLPHQARLQTTHQ